MRAMVLAAGLGARLEPLTEFLPKPLLPVGDGSALGLSIHRSLEPLLGTAGGVKALADYFGGETAVVVSGDDVRVWN